MMRFLLAFLVCVPSSIAIAQSGSCEKKCEVMSYWQWFVGGEWRVQAFQLENEDQFVFSCDPTNDVYVVSGKDQKCVPSKDQNGNNIKLQYVYVIANGAFAAPCTFLCTNGGNERKVATCPPDLPWKNSHKDWQYNCQMESK